MAAITNKAAAAPATDAAFAVFATPIGGCAIAWRGARIIGAALPEPSEPALRARLRSRFPGAAEAPPPLVVAAIIDRIVRMMAGERIDLASVDLDFGRADPFDIQVYAAARRIKCGEVRTYGEVAAEIGSPGAARAVGAALGRNPVPIIVPCHRVLAAAGRSGGFSAPGGTATKFKLLEIEQARRPGDPELFESLPLAVKPR